MSLGGSVFSGPYAAFHFFNCVEVALGWRLLVAYWSGSLFPPWILLDATLARRPDLRLFCICTMSSVGAVSDIFHGGQHGFDRLARQTYRGRKKTLVFVPSSRNWTTTRAKGRYVVACTIPCVRIVTAFRPQGREGRRIPWATTV